MLDISWPSYNCYTFCYTINCGMASLLIWEMESSVDGYISLGTRPDSHCSNTMQIILMIWSRRITHPWNHRDCDVITFPTHFIINTYNRVTPGLVHPPAEATAKDCLMTWSKRYNNSVKTSSFILKRSAREMLSSLVSWEISFAGKVFRVLWKGELNSGLQREGPDSKTTESPACPGDSSGTENDGSFISPALSSHTLSN